MHIRTYTLHEIITQGGSSATTGATFIGKKIDNIEAWDLFKRERKRAFLLALKFPFTTTICAHCRSTK